MLDSFMKEMKGMVVEDMVVEEEINEGDDTVPQEDVITKEAKEKEEEEEKEDAAEGQIDKEVEIPIDVDSTPILNIPQTVDGITSPGKPKPSKKRKRRSRK